jgi:pyridinium-3,5-bisthiocarboxylic acid mononucleotide nickel chelatase
LKDIREIIEKGKLTPRQRDLALGIFQRIGEAEAAVHGMELEKIHFHEVGALDSIADIVGSAIGLDLLNVGEFTSRPVPTGHGTVKAAHGVMPVPAPATAALLKGVPLASSPIKSELTTPTGAAILTSVVSRWLESPVMRIESIGYGAGQKDFAEQANVLRLFVGTAVEPTSLKGYQSDEIWVLETNLDDVPGEVIGYCFDQLFAAGALDVFTIPIQMKKHRPGVLLTVLVDDQHLAAAEQVLFQETGTLGIRRHRTQRHKLHRTRHSVKTQWGEIAGKLGWREGERPVFSPEYEACAKIAREHRVPLRVVIDEALSAYRH